ncbi:MAG: BglG family transcription antiterminator [Coriobacteriaceae bacterium]
MELSDRQREELDIIGNRDYTPASILANKFQVSERTIRSDIASINRCTSERQQILLRKRHGYYLNSQEHSSSINTGYESEVCSPADSWSTPALDSKVQRKRHILEKLLFSETAVSFADLSSSTCIAEDTLRTYMRSIRRILSNYGLDCISHRNKGVLVYGPEEGRRDCFLDNCIDRSRITYVSEFDNLELAACSDVNLQEVWKVVSKSLADTQLTATDRAFKDIVLDVGISAQRVIRRHFIDSSNISNVIPIAELAADSICRQLSSLINVPIDKPERDYIYRKLLKHTNAGESKIDTEQLNASINALLDMAYTQYSINLRNDKILKESLFKHLSLTFSEGFDAPSPNPLLQTIKQGYPLSYDIALASTTTVFNHPPYELDEGQVGYIALHIGSALSRMHSSLNRACNVLLICSEARSVQQIFESKIRGLFGDEINIVGNISYHEYEVAEPDELHVDLAISTIPLGDKAVDFPCLLVSWNLPSHDIQAISRAISQVTNYWNDFVDKFFCKSSFVHLTDTISQDNLLKLMCFELVSSGIAGRDLFDQVEKREQISDTSIAELMAIPHPLTPCSNQTRISVAILDQPVEWGPNNKPVRIVLLLVIKPSEKGDIEQLYDMLTQVISNSTLQRRLLEVKTYDEFVAVIKESYIPSGY